MIRRLLGKPRRCSAAFFAEERESLEAKREKVRILQRGGALPAEQLHDLPQQIPALLPVGTKVTCKLDSWRHTPDMHHGHSQSLKYRKFRLIGKL